MIYNDELFLNMLLALEENPKTEAGPHTLEAYAFIDEPLHDEIKLTSFPMMPNIILAEYEGDNKELLKEKKRAIEVGDIIEEAHPETAFMADGPMGTGVVENGNEQQTKIKNTIFNMPSGFVFNTLAAIATSLEEKGKTKDAKAVDEVLNYLVKNALETKDFFYPANETKDFLKMPDVHTTPVDPATPPHNNEYPIQTPPPRGELPLTHTILDPENTPTFFNRPTGKPKPAAEAPKARQVPSFADHIEQKKLEQVAPAASPSPAAEVPALVPESTAPVKSDTVKLEPEKKPKPWNQPGSPKEVGQPKNVLNIQNPEVQKSKLSDVGNKIEKRVKNVEKLSPPTPGRFGWASKLLKSRGGRLGLLGAAIVGLGAGIYAIWNNISGDALESLDEIASKSQNPEAKAQAVALKGLLQKIAQELEQTGLTEEAVHDIAEAEQRASAIDASVLDSDPAKSASKGLSALVHKFTQSASDAVKGKLEEKGAVVGPTNDAERIAGIQTFFNRRLNANLAVTGKLDSDTKEYAIKFIDKMRDDLGINPPNLTFSRILQYGTDDQLEKLFMIWKNPNRYVRESPAKN